ncbi:pollen-specific LIM protein 2c [Hibiscus trionum]|uniref:Pollen-specific LIM protein 2c n=1 Tax=Hibiscus trionum TaxID=183268 RepID=A0A9W7IS76_HIBTR|nr:pollen-specific LIM protein 2c [Hibiscus trionum]
MGFSGTTDKCTACNKTVHFIDLVTADGISYHKTCFRCSRCNGRLVMGNYCSMGGDLYCKPHFEQLFKESGCYMKNFQSRKSEKQNGLARAPSRVASFFSGTVDKCGVCNKTAYPLEKVTVEGENYHKSCFRCSPGGCFLTPSTYAANDGVLYCKHHFAQMFMEKGCYIHLTRQTSLKKNSAISSPKAALEPEEAVEAEQEYDEPVAQCQ